MPLIFSGGQLLFRNGQLAMSTACCCGCSCCTHMMTWCQSGCKLDVSITGGVVGTGSMSAEPTCPVWRDTGITLTSNCGGFAVVLSATCEASSRCGTLEVAWANPPLDIFGNGCRMIPDTSRGADSTGWYSFQCDPLRWEYHFKTDQVGSGPCSCGSGTAVTVVVTEKTGCT